MLSNKEFIHPNSALIKPWSTPPAPRAPESSGKISSGKISTGERHRAVLRWIPSVPNDEEVIDFARKADIDAFGKLIQCHTGMCTRRAWLIMHNLNDTEDAVQSAFRKAFQYREQFHGNGAFAAWLGRIVENECLMRIREKRNALFVYLDNPTKENIRLELVSQAMNQEDKLGQEEVRKVLHEEMSRMPAPYRSIMQLRDEEHLPMPDVANRLGVSVPAAKSRLQRARKELRSRIGKHCGRKGPGTLLETAANSETAYARAN